VLPDDIKARWVLDVDAGAFGAAGLEGRIFRDVYRMTPVLR
jgi:hypothetical protein